MATTTKIPFLGRTSVQYRLRLALVYVLVLSILAVIMIPFSWMISTALKPLKQTFVFPPIWIPDPIQWRNFVEGWTYMPFTLYLRNTVFVTSFVMIGQMASTTVVAFAFARLHAPGKNFLFVLVLSTLMLPSQVVLIPNFILFRYLGWMNTYLPLIVPTYFASNAFFIFLLRQFFMTVPLELDDAALIDGCSTFDIYWRIILPLSKPVLAAQAVFIFFNQWNDFLEPLIYLQSPKLYTLAIGLTFFHQVAAGEGGVTPWNLLMAVTILVAIPPMLVFFVAQRSFVRGIVLTGIK